MSIFQSFRSTVNGFVRGGMALEFNVLADPVTGSPVGLQHRNGSGPDGIWTPIDLTLAQIAAPTALMIADLNAVYRLNVAPYTRYISNGTILVGMGGGGESDVPYTETDRSGTITLGGTAQTVMAAVLTRRGALIQNQSAADMYVNTTGTATITGNSEWIPPGSEWTTGSNTAAISLIGGTTGQVFAAKEW